VKDEERNYREVYISLWLREYEAVRYLELWDRVRRRSPYIKKSDMNRELLGLSPPNALTEKEILFFRTGKK
jgi:hypothetical protein